MPKGRAYDGGHTVFTDHSIPRKPANYDARKIAPKSLESYFAVDTNSITADRNLGIAWAQLAENYRDPRLFEKAWPHLRNAAATRTRDPALYAKIGEALESAAKTSEAEKYYRLSLEQAPYQIDVLLRLAALVERSGKGTEASALRNRAAKTLPKQ